MLADLEGATVGKLGARLHANDSGGARQTELPGKASVAVQSVAFIDNADGALFDAAVALVVLDNGIDGGRCGEGAFRLSAQGRLVGRDRKQIGAAGVFDGLRDFGVSGDAVD